MDRSAGHPPTPTVRPGIAELTDALLAGDRRGLPQLVSAVEEGGPRAREIARRIVGPARDTRTVGVTGPAGVGKSTLIDGLIGVLRQQGSEVAVLAVDPSSPYSGGALLGDRVRMMSHVLDPGVFVRSMATRGHLGGLAVAVPEVVRLLATAGFAIVVVETVGVGQSEVEIAGATDTTVVVLAPGSGDGVQANKAGLLEVADVFVVNRADDSRAPELERDLAFMIGLTSWPDEWRPPVVRTVATTGEGVDDVAGAVEAHAAHLRSSGLLEHRRRQRSVDEVQRVLAARVGAWSARAVAEDRFAVLLRAVADGERDPWSVADDILTGFGTNGPL